MNLKPIKTKVLLRELPQEEKTKSGIIWTDKDVILLKGVVSDFGDEVQDLELGEVVYYNKRAGQEIQLGGKESDYRILDVEAIILKEVKPLC